MGMAAILINGPTPPPLSFPSTHTHPKEAPYEIWAELVQRLQRSRLKMLTDGRMHGRTTDEVITIAHP